MEVNQRNVNYEVIKNSDISKVNRKLKK